MTATPVAAGREDGETCLLFNFNCFYSLNFTQFGVLLDKNCRLDYVTGVLALGFEWVRFRFFSSIIVLHSEISNTTHLHIYLGSLLFVGVVIVYAWLLEKNDLYRLLLCKWTKKEEKEVGEVD